MRRLVWLSLSLFWLAACTHRVRCEGALEPINAAAVPALPKGEAHEP